MVTVVMSLSVGLCSSTQSGCSLAVSLDGLAANEQDGSSPEAASAVDGAGEVDAGPEAPSHSPPTDAHEGGAADGARDNQTAGGDQDSHSDPVDGGASEAMPAGPEAGTTNEERDAAATDTIGAGQDAEDRDAVTAQPDAPAADTSGEDLGPQGDGGPGAPMDAAPNDGGDSEAGTDPHPLACPASPLVSATLELANAPSSQTACSYVPSEVPRFYAAVDPKVFNNSAACGACLIIETPAGTVEARVVDVGPEASRPNPTAVAVSRAAITVLAPDGSTLVTQGVDWHFVPCTLSAPGMTFKIQTGSNASYAGVLIENHRYRLAKVEYKIRQTYYPLARSTYNYWIASQGMGTGPFTLRMTDELGQTVEQTGIPLAPGNVFRGEAQFPSCSP